MCNQQTTAYFRKYIDRTISNGILNTVVECLIFIFEWTVTFGVGYEVEKITSGEEKTTWTYVEFFVVLQLCAWIWIIKFCCIRKSCIKRCVKCYNKNSKQKENEKPEEKPPKKKVGIFKRILNTLHMTLNRLAIGAIGYELRKQLFTRKLKPFGFWDYVEVISIVLFTIWILSIKYCLLKCYCLKCCCPGCFNKKGDKADKETINVRIELGESTSGDKHDSDDSGDHDDADDGDP